MVISRVFFLIWRPGIVHQLWRLGCWDTGRLTLSGVESWCGWICFRSMLMWVNFDFPLFLISGIDCVLCEFDYVFKQNQEPYYFFRISIYIFRKVYNRVSYVWGILFSFLKVISFWLWNSFIFSMCFALFTISFSENILSGFRSILLKWT